MNAFYMKSIEITVTYSNHSASVKSYSKYTSYTTHLGTRHALQLTDSVFICGQKDVQDSSTQLVL